jgi:hypothetical protein
MSNLWVEIEALVLDGVLMDAGRGQRLANLTEIALARLLEQRGTASRVPGTEAGTSSEQQNAKPSTMRLPAGANEERLAEELALILYRAIDRAF